MKYAITVNDEYKALVTIEMGAKNFSGDQPFSGSITTDKFGVCQITDGQVQPGSGLLTGNTTIDGVSAEFSARIAGNAISGTITYCVIWTHRAAFEGMETT